jgi:energy-converting hydrogenase B subunit G
VTLILAVVLIANIPLIPKFKIEQEDSLEKMVFYAVMTLAILGIFLYWGGSLV